MATILNFPELQTVPRKRKSRRNSASAEIVMFPGIRYEREELSAIPERDPRRQAIERDRLQLIE